MAIVRYVVQTEEGRTLGQFPSLAEMNEYLAPRALRVVGTQRYARPSPVWNTVNDGEYPPRMPEMDYDDIYIVRDQYEEYRRHIGIDLAEINERMVMGRWAAFPSYEGWKINKEEMEKAHQLLLECLSDKEKEELESFRTITIDTEIGLFRIKMENFEMQSPPAFNAVYKGIKYCAVLKDTEHYPRADHFIAQILLIRTDPRKFLSLANKGENWYGG